MALNLGATSITALYLGTTSVSAAYLGSAQVFNGAAEDPFDVLLATLLSDAAQVIAHPLLDGYMFQDRAGTIPVTADGQLIGHVLDAGGGGYHATAISVAARGVFRDVGGIRWVEDNGVNTAYSTPALTAPGVDKVQLFAGVRKLSDAASGILIEMSVNASGSIGSFYITAPELTANAYGFLPAGTSNGGFLGVPIASYPAPVTSVLTAVAARDPASAQIRIDGAQVASNTASQGTGNYNPAGTYPLYYGARNGTSLFFNGRHYATLGPITRFSAANATTAQIEAAEAYYTARVI